MNTFRKGLKRQLLIDAVIIIFQTELTANEKYTWNLDSIDENFATKE